MVNNQLIYTGLIAACMTPLVSYIKREHWSQQVKFLVAVIASFAAAAIEVAADHHVTNLSQFISLVGISIATTQVVYQFYFSGSDFEKVIQGTVPPNAVDPAPSIVSVSVPPTTPIPTPITDVSVSNPNPTPVTPAHDGGTDLSSPATPTTAPIPTPITG